jgi:hypothetical protein
MHVIPFLKFPLLFLWYRRGNKHKLDTENFFPPLYLYSKQSGYPKFQSQFYQ